MNKYLRDLKASFQKVGIDHFHNQAINKDGLLYRQIAENHFTTELKRHFQNLMELPENNDAYLGLICHFDIYKSLRGNPVKPDLVLHAGQTNRDRQEIYVEVKLKYTLIKELSDDLEKLERAISKELKFNYAVLIVVNETLERTESTIKSFIYDRHFSDTALRKLYLFHAVKDFDNTKATYTIKNFLKIRNDG